MSRDGLPASVLVFLLVVSCSIVPAGEPAVKNEVRAACLKHGHFDFKLAEGPVESISLSSGGSRLAVGSLETPPTVWDTRTGKQIAALTEADTRLVLISPGGRQLAAYHAKRSVGIWDIETGKMLRVLEVGTGDVRCFAYSADGRRIGTGCTDGSITIQEVATGKVVHTLEDGRSIDAVTFSPDERFLASASYTSYSWRAVYESKAELLSPSVTIWDAQTGKKIRYTGNLIGTRDIAFSPDGSCLAVNGGVSSLWDTSTWKCVGRFPAGAIAFSPDGKRLATAGDVWDVATGRRIGRIELPLTHYESDYVPSVAFLPDGEYLGLAGGVVRLVPAERVSAAAPVTKPDVPAAPAPPSSPNDRELLAAGPRFTNFHFGIWNSLTHAASNVEDAKRALEVAAALGSAMHGSVSPAKKAGGLPGMKKKLVSCLASTDVVVRGNAALMLGIIGDRSLAPKVAALLDAKPPQPKRKRDENDFSYVFEGVDRGRAATALGLMGASDYAARLAELLKDKDPRVRAGAAVGLGYMGAKEYGDAIVELLASRDEDVKQAGISALTLMGAKKYAPQIAKLMLDEELFAPDTKRYAAFGLANLGAREYAKDIATLLDDEFVSEAAALSLANLGAKEHASEIAGLLDSWDPSERKAGAVALGILGATDHARDLAELFAKEEEQYVVEAVAAALILMEAPAEYSRSALVIVDDWCDGQLRFHGNVPEPIHARAMKSLERMRATAGPES